MEVGYTGENIKGSHRSKDLAGIYDLVNQKKDYAREAEFLKALFKRYHVNTVLDAGCGTGIEKTKVAFDFGGKRVEDRHTMRIYSIDEMLQMLTEAGFSESRVYEGYGFRAAKPTSKNLEVFGRMRAEPAPGDP